MEEKKKTVYTQQRFTGERALFMSRDLEIADCIFADGESPLKESRNLNISNSMFQWKYPLWYCKDVLVENCALLEMARAGIWYTDNITLKNVTYEAPKGFRRCKNVGIENVHFSHAAETLWNCMQVRLTNVEAHGDYFAMNSSDMTIDGLSLVGNYSFDGCRNLTIRNSRLLSKDAFWNCENVTVTDSFISGEYLGWNAKNVVLENCTIESLQGMCYMENVVLKNCKLLNTDLAFEYSTVDADVTTSIVSVKNPISGKIRAKSIGEIIFDDPAIRPEATDIQTEE